MSTWLQIHIKNKPGPLPYEYSSHTAQDLWMDATIGMILRISNLAWPCENSGAKLATTRQP